MIELTEKIAPFDTFCEILDYDPQDCLFFDIETTGLSAASSMVFLIGTLHFDGKDWILCQRLAEGCDEEAALVEAFAAEAAKYRTILHFNGTTFDLPFLKAKSAKLRVRESLDLYQRFRPLKKMLSLTRMNQTSLEAFAGWQREDTVTGKDMVELYREYIRTAALEKVAWAVETTAGMSRADSAAYCIGLRSLLLRHNHDDIVGMTQILRLAAYLALPDGQIESQSVACEITRQQTEPQSDTSKMAMQQTEPRHDTHKIVMHQAESQHDTHKMAMQQTEPQHDTHKMAMQQTEPQHDTRKMTMQQTESDIIEQTAIFHFILKYALPQPLALQFSFKNASADVISLQACGREALLAVPLTCGELRYFFPDYRNYYYLPLEDQVIHKSVGAYVDKAHREPAKPANCYVRRTGCFLPQGEELFTPCLRRSYESKALYFECTDNFLKDTEQVTAYLYSLLEYAIL